MRYCFLLATAAVAWACGSGTAGATSSAGSWTVYHGDDAGSGVAPAVASVDTTRPAWTSPTLDGELYGEPLVSSGSIYVATENDTVYALSPSTGAVLWSARVGNPVPDSDLPCGDITPTVGITGTPVVDPARNEIFVVADELVDGHPAHMLVGLNSTTGQKELAQDVDPPGSDPAALLQRTGLTLDAGRVVFGLGGNYGDCSTYRGRVASVPEVGGTPTFFTVDAAAGDSQGAVWMGGAAPAVDATGDIWVSVGNGSVNSASRPYDDSDSVLELSPSLALLQYFAPATWPSDNAHDLDLSAEPTLLPDGQVVAAGKAGIAYLLAATHLGGIGGQEATLRAACDGNVDGGTAVVGTTVYLPCQSGITAVHAVASLPSLRLLWSSRTGGGPPIVAAGLVWTIGQNGTLYGLSPTTGKVLQSASVGTPANHFPTPSVGAGLLLAPSARRVTAFTAADTTTTGTTTTTTSPPRVTSATGRSSSGGGLTPGPLAGIVVGTLAVAGGAAWLIRRRRVAGRGP